MLQPVEHLYIHIPFCPTKCSYCAFETHVGSMKLAAAYLDALAAELDRVASRGASGPLKTVYFGGGTPTMLPPSAIGNVLDSVATHFDLLASVEITIESHPDTVSGSTLRAYRRLGVNRISIGGESLVHTELADLGRCHEPERVLACIDLARTAGFRSVAIDLMFGLPGQTMGSWEHTLQAVLDAGVDHLSLYPLSVEPRTLFARRRREGRLDLPGDERVIEMYTSACKLLATHSFEHYEVASWARPGHRCAHNLAYWHNRQYFGVGVGAHAYVKPWRTENVRGTQRYIETLLEKRSPVAHREPILPAVELAEAVILGLRLLADGLDMNEVARRFHVDFQRKFAAELDELQGLGLLKISSNIARIPEESVPVANEVWQRFVSV